MDFGIDESWPDVIDPDSFFGNLLGEPDGQVANGGFRCGVIHILPREPYFAAPDERLTMDPPFPPYSVEIGFTASRAQKKDPVTFTAKILCILSAFMPPTRV